MKKILIITAVLFVSAIAVAQQGSLPMEQEREKLLAILGAMPDRPELRLEAFEEVRLGDGYRYKIKYLAEDADPRLNLPEDWIYAYLFIPDHNPGEKLPAMVAIHQDNISYHVGKDEPAGIQGDSNMFYGLELYNRGYVVICPDRYYHAERRNFGKNPWFDFMEPDYERDFMLWKNQVSVLFMNGRTHYSKEAYDQSRAVDVLFTLDCVDTDNIGTIGHSAGGVAAGYFAFFDQRVKLCVSSCGLYDINRIFHYDIPQPFPGVMAIPGLIKEGYSTNDFVRHIYPRTLILTRGNSEWGEGEPESEEFLKEAERFAEAYRSNGSEGEVITIFFDEDGGDYSFPAAIWEQVYQVGGQVS